ncbi:cysteine hydrolase [Acidiferrimicrobium sp. IK]|uniref:cysteine hydrolase family protein n=1 Tax=Acidiferrimicrobium sp. IK TaxID=2871700 RepID=UPI0021CB873A|nr:isochorismatase family cysteine hydrolase [Acidiferrimicrobium sp. IK]MCU4183189.1 cysteine hydrolase [Acidiferrimicrobium sp. IK]
MPLIGASPRNAWRATDGRIDLRRARRAGAPGWDLDAAPQPLTLDPDRTGILVVDMQNDFCHPDGWLASIGVDVTPARAPIGPLLDLLPRLRAAGMPVVWVDWGNRPDRANLAPNVLHVYDPDGASTGIGAELAGAGPVLQAGSWNAAVVDELTPDPGDITVDKYRMSGFWDTPLDSILRNLDLTTLLFAGVNADQCVLATLADAACAGYDCVMVTDCCATTSPGFCWDATVYNVRQCFGFTTTAAELGKAAG